MSMQMKLISVPQLMPVYQPVIADNSIMGVVYLSSSRGAPGFVQKIELKTLEVSYIGPEPSEYHVGTAYASNRIYAHQWGGDSFIIDGWDFEDNTFFTIPIPTPEDYYSFVPISDTQFVGVPWDASYIIHLDATTNTVYTGASVIATPGDWTYGVLAPNGKVYMPPYGASSIIEYDPNTQTVTYYGDFTGSDKWYGAIVTPDGLVYGVPRDSSQILEFNTNTKELKLYDTGVTSDDKWWGGFYYNRKVYMTPLTYPAILEFDPQTKEIKFYSTPTTAGAGAPGIFYNNKGYVLYPEIKSILVFYKGEWIKPETPSQPLSYSPNRYYFFGDITFLPSTHEFLSTTENARYSYPSQTVDKETYTTGKILSLDDSCTLDGTYILAGDGVQMGWWGNQLAGESGYFSEPYPTLRIDCRFKTAIPFFNITFNSPRKIYSVFIAGDTARNEYPTLAEINFYDVYNNLLRTVVFTPTSPLFSANLDTPIDGVAYAELVVKKWSHPGRQVKITEFDVRTGLIVDDTRLLSASLHEEIVEKQQGCPIGAIATKELALEIANLDGLFDEDEIGEYTIKNQTVSTKLLALDPDTNTFNEIPLGTFYSAEWQINEEEYKVLLRAHDKLKRLTSASLTTQLKKPLRDFLELILSVSNMNYYISQDLPNYTVSTPANMVGRSLYDLLKLLLEASGAVLYIDRSDQAIVIPASYLSEGQSIDSLTTPQSFRKRRIAKDIFFNRIEVILYPFGESETTVTEEFSTTIPTGTSQQLFSLQYPATGELSVVIDSSEVSALSWGKVDDFTVEVKFEASSETTTTVRIAYETSKYVIVAEDTDSQNYLGTSTYTVDNPFVQHKQQAEELANTLLNFFTNIRYYEVQFAGKPWLSLGDIITLDKKKAVILAHELKYDPTLDQIIRVREAT